jgi:predicted negative regulator of RcsB-dependent stress response
VEIMERILEALKKNRENAIWGAVALAVVIGGGIYYWWNTNKTKMEKGEIGYLRAMLMNLMDERSLEEVARSSKGTIWGDMALLDLANSYYLKGDVKKALEYVREVSGKNFALSVAKAIYTYALNNDINELKKDFSLDYPSISQYIKIKLAENLIEEGKFKEAKSILEPLAKDPFSPYNSKAMSLLRLVEAFTGR